MIMKQESDLGHEPQIKLMDSSSGTLFNQVADGGLYHCWSQKVARRTETLLCVPAGMPWDFHGYSGSVGGDPFCW